jgi:hypothetical protein
VTRLNDGTLAGIYSTRRELCSATMGLFGFYVGFRKIGTIIAKGGIVHSTKGTFLISVAGIEV